MVGESSGLLLSGNQEADKINPEARLNCNLKTYSSQTQQTTAFSYVFLPEDHLVGMASWEE